MTAWVQYRILVLLGAILFSSWALGQDEKLAPADTANQEASDVPRVSTACQFPGGEAAMYLFLRNNLIYPDTLRNNYVTGTVIIQYTISETGAVTELEITRSPHPAFSEAVVAAFRKMPNWEPATMGGVPVSVKQFCPIRFHLK